MCNNNFPHSLVCARAGYSGYRPGRGDMRYKLAGACVLAYLHAERNNSSSNSHVRTRTSSGLRAKTGTSRRRSGKHENESECELLFCSGRFIDRLCFPDGIATTPHACLGAVPFLRCTQRATCANVSMMMDTEFSIQGPVYPSRTSQTLPSRMRYRAGGSLRASPCAVGCACLSFVQMYLLPARIFIGEIFFGDTKCRWFCTRLLLNALRSDLYSYPSRPSKTRS